MALFQYTEKRLLLSEQCIDLFRDIHPLLRKLDEEHERGFFMQTCFTVRERIFQLAHCSFLTPSERILLVGEIIERPMLPLKDFFNKGFMSKERYSAMVCDLEKQETEKLMSDYESEGIQWLCLMDPEYPESLRHIHEPPVLLFYKGNIDYLKNDKLAIVGSRKATRYGVEALRKLLPSFLYDYTIVSGLARGIDTEAHLQTMQGDGKTIAVVGTGLDIAYPFENRQLQADIAKEHLLLSEYPLHTPPKKHHFPMRNRLISGLCGAVVVIEAEYKSGSLITAQLALNEGREVFCVPGNITSPLSVGTNHLIQQGAHCLYDASVLLDIFT